ncbi:MAG: EAL domain-containing protein [Thermodesulfobacteriota bacterium]
MEWLDQLDYAYQPIVNIHTGRCWGYEALLRHVDRIGFSSIASFFDHVHDEGLLHYVDRQLRAKAIQKIAGLMKRQPIKLFFNLDNRLLTDPRYQTGYTRRLLQQMELSEDCICMEISERHPLNNPVATMEMLSNYCNQGFKIAVDDFGSGFSGLQMIYYIEPDYIKIDRFFIQDLCNDHKKRLFAGQIVNIAHLLGSIVIAEGVESESEFFTCLSIGCDLIQGFFVQRPQTDVLELQCDYPHIYELARRNTRSSSSHDMELICSQLVNVQPIVVSDSIQEVFERFRRINSRQTFLPVVNQRNEPIGIIREDSIKEYAYSKYGRDLLLNPRFGKNILQFVSKCPIEDVHVSVERLLENYSQNEGIEAILMVDTMEYKGFLSASSLLRILNEKNLAIARDQNPLTRLPGNTLIHQYLSHALHQTSNRYILVWFDFDNFKPYNDLYGFRNGDRLILRFTELLKAVNLNNTRFIGHIGGDDFFLGFKEETPDHVLPVIRNLVETFRKDAESFYDAKTLFTGFVVSKGRDGKDRQYPLVSVSAVVLDLLPGRSADLSSDDLSILMGELKSKAKMSPEKICIHRLE